MLWFQRKFRFYAKIKTEVTSSTEDLYLKFTDYNPSSKWIETFFTKRICRTIAKKGHWNTLQNKVETEYDTTKYDKSILCVLKTTI